MIEVEVHSYYVKTGLPDRKGRDGVVAAVEIRRILSGSDRCAHCDRRREHHGKYSRCSGGETQFEIKACWKWKIKDAELVEGPVLNKSLEWQYESLPSGRSDAELGQTRYASLIEALDVVKAYVKERSDVDVIGGSNAQHS